MFTVLSSLNWLSVLAAFAAYFLLGAVWYMFLFPRAYRASLGRPEAPAAGQPQSPLYLVGPAVCTLVVTITSAVLLGALHITTYGQALTFALVVGLGYLVANTVNIAINPNMPRPFFYGLITGSYHLLGLTLASLIVVAMH